MTAVNWYAFGSFSSDDPRWYSGSSLDIEFYNDFASIGDCTVDWGDGSSDTHTADYVYPFAHTWPVAGTYTISATITDTTGTATSTIFLVVVAPASYSNPLTPVELGDTSEVALDFTRVPIHQTYDSHYFKSGGELNTGYRIAWLRYTASATDTWLLEITATDDLEEATNSFFDVIDLGLDILQGGHGSPGARPWNITVGGTPLMQGHTYLIGIGVRNGSPPPTSFVARWHRQVAATGGKVMLVAQAFTDPVIVAVKPGAPQVPLFQPAFGEERPYDRDIRVTSPDKTELRYHWLNGVELVNTIGAVLSGDPGWGGTFSLSVHDTHPGGGKYAASYYEPFTGQWYYDQAIADYDTPFGPGELFTATWFDEFTVQLYPPILAPPTVQATPLAWYGTYFDYPSNITVNGDTVYVCHESHGSGVAAFSGTKWLNGYPAPAYADSDLGPGLEAEWVLWDPTRNALVTIAPGWPIALLPFVSNYSEASRYIVAFNDDGLVDYWYCPALGQAPLEIGTYTVTERYVRPWNGFVVDGDRVWIGVDVATYTYNYDGVHYSAYEYSPRTTDYIELRLNSDHTAEIVSSYSPTLTTPSTSNRPVFMVTPDRTKMLCLYSRLPGQGGSDFNEWYFGGAWVQVYDLATMEMLTEFRYLPYPNVAGTQVSADGWGSYNFFFYPTMLVDDDNAHLWMVNGAYHDDADVMHNFLFKIPLFGDPDVRYASMREPVAIWQPTDFTDTPDWKFGTVASAGGWSVGRVRR